MQDQSQKGIPAQNVTRSLEERHLMQGIMKLHLPLMRTFLPRTFHLPWTPLFLGAVRWTLRTWDTTKPGLWTMDWTVDWTMDWAFLYELSCSTTICFAAWLERLSLWSRYSLPDSIPYTKIFFKNSFFILI